MIRLSNRSVQFTAIGCSALLLVLASGITESAIAHGGEDHGGGGKGAGELDPHAPRVISPETAKAIGLTTFEVDTKAIAEVIHLGGVVRAMPDRRFIITPTTAGRVVAVTKQVGDAVAKGDVIARLDSPEQARSLYEVSKLEAERARVASSKSAAEARVVFLTADVERARTLVNNGISAREVASREVDLAVAKTEVVSLAAELQVLAVSRKNLLAMNNLDPDTPEGAQQSTVLDLRSSIAGILVSRSVTPGAWVQAGTDIAVIADYATVQVEAEVPESLIPLLGNAAGKSARVSIAGDPALVLTGTVRFLTPELDPQKRTAHLVIEVANTDGHLRGEQWVESNVIIREVKEALVVPRAAVLEDGPRRYVFEADNGKYVPHDVVLGITDDQVVEVSDGLAPGDVVVVGGAWSLSQVRTNASSAKAH